MRPGLQFLPDRGKPEVIARSHLAEESGIRGSDSRCRQNRIRFDPPRLLLEITAAQRKNASNWGHRGDKKQVFGDDPEAVN